MMHKQLACCYSNGSESQHARYSEQFKRLRMIDVYCLGLYAMLLFFLLIVLYLFKYVPLLIRLNLIILPFKSMPAMFILCCLFSLSGLLICLYMYVCLFLSTIYGK